MEITTKLQNNNNNNNKINLINQKKPFKIT
jgi:hypothetical protein